MEGLKTPQDWGNWIFDNIHDEKNHPELEAALVKYIPVKDHQLRIKNAFLQYAKVLSVDANSTTIEDIETSLFEAEELEKELLSWIEKQQPELTKDMHYAALRSLRALTAAMEQLCWIAERLKGDYDKVGLEYQEMTRLCVSDAACALDLCGHWIDVMIAHVQTLNAEARFPAELRMKSIVDCVTLDITDIVHRLDSSAQRASLMIHKQTERQRAEQKERDNALENINNLRSTLGDLRNQRGMCVSESLENSIRNVEKRIEDMQKKNDDLWKSINDCVQNLSRLQCASRLISDLRDNVGTVDFLDEQLRNTMTDFKVKLDAYRRRIVRIHNAEGVMGSTTSWKDRAAVSLLNTTKESLFCYPTVPYARRIVESILVGYDDKRGVPQSVKDAVKMITDAIANLHEPFPLPLSPMEGKVGHS